MSAVEDNKVLFAEFGFPQACKTCSAHRHGICGALRSPELFGLSKHTSQRHIPKGQTLTYDGDAADEIINIVSGIVKLTKNLEDGRHQIVALQFAPEFVGRPFADENNLNAEAATDLEICIIPKTAIREASEAEPAFERRMFQQTTEQLDQSRNWLLALGRKTAHERVVCLLELIRSHDGKSVPDRAGAMQFELGLTRSEIADFLGLTIETVSRQMTLLRKEGLIEIEKHHMIVVPDVQRFQEACEDDLSGT